MIRNISVAGENVSLTLALKSRRGPLQEKFLREIGFRMWIRDTSVILRMHLPKYLD